MRRKVALFRVSVASGLVGLIIIDSYLGSVLGPRDTWASQWLAYHVGVAVLLSILGTLLVIFGAIGLTLYMFLPKQWGDAPVTPPEEEKTVDDDLDARSRKKRDE